MKELCGIARNLTLVPSTEATLVGVVEVVFMVSEPDYRTGPGGIERFRTTESLRFGASAKSLRSIAEDFTKYADEIEALEASTRQLPL